LAVRISVHTVRRPKAYQEVFLVSFRTVPPPSNKVHGAIPPFDCSYTQQSETCVSSRLKAMQAWRQLYRGLELRTGHTNRCRKESANQLISQISRPYICGREPSAASPCADGRPRHAQAAIRGIETSPVAPLTLGRIRWCVTRENPSLRQAAVVIPILGLYSARASLAFTASFG
jgi:hypothetical protein